jgi:hypothetical protein
MESRIDVDEDRVLGFGAPPSRGSESERVRDETATRMMLVMMLLSMLYDEAMWDVEEAKSVVLVCGRCRQIRSGLNNVSPNWRRSGIYVLDTEAHRCLSEAPPRREP